MTSVGAAERDAFADLLLEVGPDAPTCCTGWSARDVCIHLVLFERRPDSWFGHMVGDRNARARAFYEEMVERERERPWAELVKRFRAGPRFGPLAVPAARDRMFLREYVIHHEDVRRGNGLAPRTNIEAVQKAMWEKLPGFSRMAQPRDLGVDASWPDHTRQQLRRGTPSVELIGEPLETLLLLFGRTSVARVDVKGPPEARDRFTIRDTSTLRALPRVAIID